MLSENTIHSQYTQSQHTLNAIPPHATTTERIYQVTIHKLSLLANQNESADSMTLYLLLIHNDSLKMTV